MILTVKYGGQEIKILKIMNLVESYKIIDSSQF